MVVAVCTRQEMIVDFAEACICQSHFESGAIGF